MHFTTYFTLHICQDSLHVLLTLTQHTHTHIRPQITMMSLYNQGMMATQERLWRETTTDDPTTLQDAQRGGLVPTEIDPKMYHDIQTALTRLVSKADQLVDNVTTNIAESWMHIRSKYNGGKVINRSQSGSWQHRCMGAGLQQNEGKQWGPEVWGEMTNSPPNEVFVDTAERSAKKLASDNKRKATDEAKAKRRQSKYTRIDDTLAARRAYSRHDDGVLPDEMDDDISPDLLEQLKQGYYSTKVVITSEEARKLRHKQDSKQTMTSGLLRDVRD